MSFYFRSNDFNTPRYSIIYEFWLEFIVFWETSCDDVIAIPSLLFLCNMVANGMPIFHVTLDIILFNIFLQKFLGVELEHSELNIS
jgi:hypothetical protein